LPPRQVSLIRIASFMQSDNRIFEIPVAAYMRSRACRLVRGYLLHVDKL
jgi:hypothetical protein